MQRGWEGTTPFACYFSNSFEMDPCCMSPNSSWTWSVESTRRSDSLSFGPVSVPFHPVPVAPRASSYVHSSTDPLGRHSTRRSNLTWLSMSLLVLWPRKRAAGLQSIDWIRSLCLLVRACCVGFAWVGTMIRCRPLSSSPMMAEAS